MRARPAPGWRRAPRRSRHRRGELGVRGQVLGPDAREPARRTPVALVELGVGRQAAAEQAARERREGQEADPELLAGVEDLGLHTALEQRVLALQARDRVHGRSAAQVRRERLGQADPADLALVDELGERADGLLDRRCRDRRGAAGRGRSCRPRAGAGSPRRRSRTYSGRPSIVPGRPTTLPNLVATTNSSRPSYRAPDELLVGPVAVDVGGIEEGTPSSSARWIAAMPSRRRIAIGPGHRDAAESDRRDLGADPAELTRMHAHRLRPAGHDALRAAGESEEDMAPASSPNLSVR